MSLPAASPHGRANALLIKVAEKISTRLWKVMMFGYHFVDRTSLILGFIALSTGIATTGRFFVSTTPLNL